MLLFRCLLGFSISRRNQEFNRERDGGKMAILEMIGTVLEALCGDFCVPRKKNYGSKIEEFEMLGLIDISSEDDSLLPVNEGLMDYCELEKIRLIDFSVEDDCLLSFQANALLQSSTISDGKLLLEENSQEEKDKLDSLVQREEEFSDSEYLTPQSFGQSSPSTSEMEFLTPLSSRQSSPSTSELEGQSTQSLSDSEYFTPQSCRRQSLSWDDAFSTNRGLLDFEELCSINRGYRNFEMHLVARKLEKSFDDMADSQSKVKHGGRKPNSTSQTKRTCSSQQCKVGKRHTKTSSQGQTSSASKKPPPSKSPAIGLNHSQASSKSARRKNDPKSSTASIPSTNFRTPQKLSRSEIKSKSSATSKHFSSGNGLSSIRSTKSTSTSSLSSSTSSLKQAPTASRSSLYITPLRHIILESVATKASHSQDQLVKDTSIRSCPNSTNSSKGFKPSLLRKPSPRFGFFDLERAIMPIKLDFDYDFT